MYIRTHRKRNPISLPTYSYETVLFRIVFASVVAIIAFQLIVYAGADLPVKENVTLWDYLRIIFYFNILSEAQVFTDVVLERYYPVPDRIKKRIVIQVFVGVVVFVGIYLVMTATTPKYEDVPRAILFFGLAIGMLFMSMIMTTLMSLRLTEKWVQAQRQINEMKQEKLKMDYNSLQDQLNPHFLFNNLSVLKSLIIYDKDTAVKFTEDFTDVYRYVLQSKERKLIKFKEELEFINSYLGLHKERLGEGIQVHIDVEKETLGYDIAPLTLQLLVENAIKHNITSKAQPLTLRIVANGHELIVANKLQKKSASYSTHTGLKNLMKRYEMITEQEIEIDQSDMEFRVRIPLL